MGKNQNSPNHLSRADIMARLSMGGRIDYHQNKEGVVWYSMDGKYLPRDRVISLIDAGLVKGIRRSDSEGVLVLRYD